MSVGAASGGQASACSTDTQIFRADDQRFSFSVGDSPVICHQSFPSANPVQNDPHWWYNLRNWMFVRGRRGPVMEYRRCKTALQIHGQRWRGGESTGSAHPSFRSSVPASEAPNLTHEVIVKLFRVFGCCRSARVIECWENAVNSRLGQDL